MSLILRTDVTSVKYHENLILAGIGSSVKVFEKTSGKSLQRLLCLNGQKIYGFVPSKSGHKILVFGGKQFTVLTPAAAGIDKQVFMRLFAPVVCDDWLHSGAWTDDDNVALLTAHNVVQKWNTSTQCLTSQHCSRDNSILYSGLLLPLQDDLLVMAGTVFFQVIVHRCGDDVPLLWLQGHKGVIFSISCNPHNNTVVTTSDDRSVRIWGPNTIPAYPSNTIDFWRNIDLICKHELYGHTARVMRSCITESNVISVGEDSAICFWNHDGSLAKKILTHQNGCIWSLDADNDSLVTGGGDCSVIIHPLTLASDYSQNEDLEIDIDSPRKVMYTARGNMIFLIENDELIHYNVEEQIKTSHKLKHESSYKLVSISSCKQMIAVADMNGKIDVFVENCKDVADITNIIDTKLKIGKILSMQWAGNRYLVICCENGAITILASKESNTEFYANFILPSCKERWLTASAVDDTKNIFILGDRCGNIHIYYKGQKDPIKSFSKVHGRYGPTSIGIRNNEIVTTGRDGTIKYFSIEEDNIKFMSSRDLQFQWVEKFLDRDENIVCGFQERVFVVYHIKTNSKLLEVSCGGGHRSWDAIRYFEKVNEDYEEFIKLVYLKASGIKSAIFQLSKVVSRNVINGTHSKEVNCLKAHQSDDKSVAYYISGGEDTTIRISSIGAELHFEDQAIFKQLSSVRTIKTCPLEDKSLLLISAGGRAQICIKNIKFSINDEIKVSSQELIDYMIKGTDKERKGQKNWRNRTIDFDPETRIMDVDYIKNADDDITIFAGCSDACLRVFSLKHTSKKPTLALTKEIKFHKTCILKTLCMTFANKEILITCTTRSEVAFWDISNLTDNAEPFSVIKTNKSGINSFASNVISNKRLLIATGGDDNSIHLVLLQASDQTNLSSLKVTDSKILDRYHSSEVTGLCLVDKYLLSTSIDQRVTLFNWGVENDDIVCEFSSQTYSDVADIQGMELMTHNSCSITVCVFGKGMEVIEMPK